jgi:Double zinc ribbon
MRCTRCGNDNRERRKFCVQCGQPLLACPSCGAPSERGEKFCGDCGDALVTAQSAGTQSPTTASTAAEIRVTPEQAAAGLNVSARLSLRSFADIKVPPNSWRTSTLKTRDGNRPGTQAHDRGSASLRGLCRCAVYRRWHLRAVRRSYRLSRAARTQNPESCARRPASRDRCATPAAKMKRA